MSDLKTQPTEASVEDFLAAVSDATQREDCRTLVELMEKVTGEKPKMWGSSIVGFGSYHYKYKSGREGDWLLTGFSPRKQNLSLYIMAGFPRFEELLKSLGKHKTGVSCLYVKKLEDIDLAVLEELVRSSYEHMVRTYL